MFILIYNVVPGVDHTRPNFSFVSNRFYLVLLKEVILQRFQRFFLNSSNTTGNRTNNGKYAVDDKYVLPLNYTIRIIVLK